MTEQNLDTQTFVDRYAKLRPGLPGAGLPWLDSFRERGIAAFARQGLPTQRAESWKYTSLRALQKTRFHNAPEAAVEVSIDRAPSLLPGGASCYRLVYVNGGFRLELSNLSDLPEGVSLKSLQQLVHEEPEFLETHLGRIAGGTERSLSNLNAALATDGFVLHLKRGTVLSLPIEIVLLGGVGPDSLAYHPRNLIVLEDGSTATVIENHCALNGTSYLANSTTEISLARDSFLHHFKVQSEGLEGFHIAAVDVEVGAGAHYDAFTLSVGAKLARNETNVRLIGEHSQCHLNGAYMVRGKQHCDNTTVIEHRVPHTTCHEVFKGVIDEQARAVFQGRIVVHRDAQKTSGHQLSKALLLSDKAEIDQKPELLIYADDVECSHGATAGDLDHDALFYLRSRGVPEAKARSILVEAFLADTIGQISAEGLCPALMSSVGHWLADTERRIRI